LDTERIDEVEKYYKPVSTYESFNSFIFWIIVALSLLTPYTNDDVVTAIFIILVIIYFVLAQLLRFILIPKAEHERRKQLLSNAFGVLLTHNKTNLYYNNSYTPSVKRLGANIMENAFFSKEVASKMLKSKRLIISGYLIALLLIFIIRHENLELIIWITQIVFSGEILTKWVKLEILRKKHEDVYNSMYSHFLHDLGESTSEAVVSVLNSFVNYEATKSLASINLSSKIFHKLNPKLSNEWDRISEELNMNDGSLTDEHK
jgi:hypothetical protein